MFRDRAIILLALGQTLIWAATFYVFPAMLLWWEADLGWSRGDLTFAITLAILTSGFAAPLAGRIIDAGRGAAMMGIGAVCSGVSLILLSLVTQPWQFYLVWVVIGLFNAGTLYEATFAMITRSRGAAAKQGIIWITLIAGFASSLSFPAVHLLASGFGWRGTLLFLGGFVALVVAPILFSGARMLGPAQDIAPANHPGSHASYLRSPVFWCLGIGFAISAIVHGATLHHLLPLLNERTLTPGFAVLIAALIGPMQVAGRLAMVAAGDRLSHRGFALAAFGLMGLSVVILAVSGSSPPLVVLFVLLFGGAYGTVSILRPVIARDLLGQENFGAKSGGLAALYMLAAASSAWLGALIWGVGGYGLMLWVLIALTGLGALFYSAAHRLGTRAL